MSEAQAIAATYHEPRVQGVKYLNAWPPLYGLMLGREPERLRMAAPSALTQRLLSREADLALAPVATLAQGSFEVARGICLGADGEVTSVLIVGECPLQEMELLLLDSASGTSVVLARLLADELRAGRALATEMADHARMAREVGGRTGAVVIGDHALALRKRYAYVLDMGEAWKRWTGLPFVFAAWIAQPGVIDARVSHMLHDSLAHGLAARREIAHLWAAQEGGDPAFYERYLTHHMQYVLDERFEAGLREFLARAQRARLFDAVSLRFAGA
jgi:cyclic dehypoxanthinyl futalosine synthase